MAAVFTKVPASPSFPRIEEGILELWDRLDAFAESNRRRQAGGKEFVFYDGPPFATGTPHYGHLLAGTIKDIVPRFWNMRGCQVERRFGWDCHGLPIENLAQKELGWKGAPEIREQGVDRFNEQCRAMVQTYVGEWRKTVRRMGRWVDFDNDYKTMDKPFMESVWWVFQQLWQQGRIYKAHRIMPYSWKLTTPLSNFEAGNNYKDVQDPAITVRFQLVHADPAIAERCRERTPEVFAAIQAGTAYALAWTTTPWTLPENLALCLGPAITYVFVEDAASKDLYLLAKDRLAAIYKKPEQYRVVAEVAGERLAGLAYRPLFPYFADQPGAFRLLTDGFVSTGDGTGIVHMAPAYGEDDYRVCRAAGIDLVDPLDEECRFTAKLPEYAGRFCKDCDKELIKRLKDEGRLVHQSTIVHSYPFCERTDTPLIYRAMEAWFVRVSDLRPRMAELNTSIAWVPEAIGSGRFGNFIADGPDWNISRNRFWGSCLPVWVNTADKADCLCFGSTAELEAAAGLPAGSITDLHKHHLDRIEIVRDGRTYRRTPEVLDCWFESGAMPYGQQHYPFENKARFEANFPAQFIAEGLDQTRGWFYSLLVLSAALFDKPAFRNVVVNGMILAEDGQKMSKTKKNYPDPNLILDQFGADALRAYLIDSPAVRAEPLRFSEAGLKEIVRTVVLPYWNALSFFTTYASVDGFDPRTWSARPVAARHVNDRWILSATQSLIRDVNTEMEGYRLFTVVPRLLSFIDDLTNWYIRSSRARFWRSEDRQDQADAYHTLYAVLTTFAKVLAPFMPFLTEEAHQRLVRPVDAAAPASVHWCDYPQVDASLIDARLEAEVATVRTVVGLGRKLREDAKLKVRQPLARLLVVSRDGAVRAAAEHQAATLADELNVKAVAVSADEAAVVSVAVKPNLKLLGKRCGPKLKAIAAALAAWGHPEVARLEAGEPIVIEGEAITAADLLLTRTPVAGAVVASAGAVTVVLDTALTPALVREGLARELISALQQARKDAGLEVSDRIRVGWDSADGELAAAVAEHAATIAREVLAVALERAPGGAVVQLNGRDLAFTITKA
ncbi:MAG: isoleucine--tRNA ligase [Planctomycetes bacterium]|nr:isoleucine--tRNA ligase [Planctomycetota bacterium]